jgi:hypothetical protein
MRKHRATGAIIALAMLLSTQCAWARSIKYKGSEEVVYVAANEPTQIHFGGEVQGGYKKNLSALHVEPKDADLIIFAREGLPDTGEAIIVRLKDGRSYSLRVRLADDEHPRDDVLDVEDDHSRMVDEEESANAPYKDKKYEFAPPSTISGLMREMVLASEFGKSNISGYRESTQYRGETVLSDGSLRVTIDRIFTGPNLWGYVLDAENMLDQGVRLNPGSFRLDGTRAVSAKNWELSPRPMNAEQQVAGQDKTKVYVITKAKRYR